MSLESNLKNKIIALVSLLSILNSTIAFADPVIAGEILPPASATMVDRPDLIREIGVGREDEPVWCYSNNANAIIISAPQREREKCQLKVSQELEKQKVLHKLQLDTLKVELDSLNKKHIELIAIKNSEIDALTEAALTRPSDYSIWWASGGVIVGVVSTLLIVSAIK